ncbi:hypothetical protein BLNAU_18569 [Blattamonas nauphoetae]|uniref:Uncharacterized protein n=1 Tax=Blattamonas nauphoetae TaxID=2049346 RepID=A0ABQ9X6J6_9EUKA|nr:hypothetical protein BLNAU_18569 [Blattamonas nauphoetae]
MCFRTPTPCFPRTPRPSEETHTSRQTSVIRSVEPSGFSVCNNLRPPPTVRIQLLLCFESLDLESGFKMHIRHDALHPLPTPLTRCLMWGSQVKLINHTSTEIRLVLSQPVNFGRCVSSFNDKSTRLKFGNRAHKVKSGCVEQETSVFDVSSQD